MGLIQRWRRLLEPSPQRRLQQTCTHPPECWSDPVWDAKALRTGVPMRMCRRCGLQATG